VSDDARILIRLAGEIMRDLTEREILRALVGQLHDDRAEASIDVYALPA
jgi:hypothetical protein